MAIATVDQQRPRRCDSNAAFAPPCTRAGVPAPDRSSPGRAGQRARDDASTASWQAGSGEVAPLDVALAGEDEPLGQLLSSRRSPPARTRRWRARHRLRARDAPTSAPRGPVRPGAEDAGGRPARRRHRARFQQRAAAPSSATDFLLASHRPTDPSFQDIMQIKQNANRAGQPGAAAARLLAPADRCARRCWTSATCCPTSRCC